MPNDEFVTPGLNFVFEARVAVGPPQDLGDVGKGGRRIVPITGGEFSGPQMRGEVLPGGADWQVLRSDGVAELEARYTPRTTDGALIYVRNHALRHGPPDVMAALAAGYAVEPATIISAVRLSLRRAVRHMRGSRGTLSCAPGPASRRGCWCASTS